MKQFPSEAAQLSFNFEVGAPALNSAMTETRAAELVMLAARQLRPGKVKTARVRFKPFRATLYSFMISPAGEADVKFHTAFQRAHEEVLSQAAGIMLCRDRRSRRQLPRDAYTAFVRAMPPGDFELPGARRGRRLSVCGPGRHRSLEESFQRINGAYFQARLAAPELCWSPVRARRVLGSYHHRGDRLIISRVMDSPKVPLFVLDYLMYHELLHKFLGIGQRDDGRRCMHGPRFRDLESRFQQYKEARQFLKRL